MPVCFSTAVQADINVQHEGNVVASESPVTLLAVGWSSSTVAEFLEAVPISHSAVSVEALERETREQATNPTWFAHRKGHVTGSVAHAVPTKDKTRELKPDTDTSSRLKRVMGFEKPDMTIPALKFGCKMEEVARRAFMSENKEYHSRHSVQVCGMFVENENPHIDASHDEIVECSYCGLGVLEIKCPYSTAHTKLPPENVSYLIQKDRKIELKSTHPYYSQVQLEMGVTKTRYSFFVYSRKGQVTVLSKPVIRDDRSW